LAGLAAAALRGLDVPLAEPVEVIVPPGSRTYRRSGIKIRHAALEPEDTELCGEWQVTSIQRTLLDIALGQPLVEAVVVADLVFHAGLTEPATMSEWAESRRGRAGIARLRRVLELADGRAESAMETRLRLLLVLAGLPVPESQVGLRDPSGRLLGRADLYYRAARLAIEYDGGTHRTSLVEDNRRQNQLLAAGYGILRFTAPDVLRSPAATVAQVQAALAARP
jgi:Protein of unknown function (DUF559)